MSLPCPKCEPLLTGMVCRNPGCGNYRAPAEGEEEEESSFWSTSSRLTATEIAELFKSLPGQSPTIPIAGMYPIPPMAPPAPAPLIQGPSEVDLGGGYIARLDDCPNDIFLFVDGPGVRHYYSIFNKATGEVEITNSVGGTTKAGLWARPLEFFTNSFTRGVQVRGINQGQPWIFAVFMADGQTELWDGQQGVKVARWKP